MVNFFKLLNEVFYDAPNLVVKTITFLIVHFPRMVLIRFKIKGITESQLIIKKNTDK